MKLFLMVEVDVINVLVLNVGWIVVDIDGIELVVLIDVVCDNGYFFCVVDFFGKLVVEDLFLFVVCVNGIQCSIVYIMEKDNVLLFIFLYQNEDFGELEWISYIGLGYLFYLGVWLFLVLCFKCFGLLKVCCWLVVMFICCYVVGIVYLDVFGEVLLGFDIFDW